MELVIGVSNSQRKLVQVVTDQGTVEEIPMPQFRKRGVPEGTFRAQSFISDFQDWRLLNPEEADSYPKAFGLHTNMDNHEVFEFPKDDYRYRVPALVIIRAVLKNKASLMDAMFTPQGLESAITPIFEEDRLSSYWIPEKSKSTINSEFLYWLYAWPSARRMFHSIFKRALAGRIGIELPIGTIQMCPKFVAEHRLSKVRFVTDINIIMLKTNEPSLGFSDYQCSTITFHHGTTGCTSVELFVGEIPMAPDGRITLNDAEWDELRQTIVWSNYEHEPRLLLDGILNKLARKEPWRKCPYPTGTWSNASNLYQVLIKSREWQKVMAVLYRYRRGILASAPQPASLKSCSLSS
jgi:hypothetical protein